MFCGCTIGHTEQSVKTIPVAANAAASAASLVGSMSVQPRSSQLSPLLVTENGGGIAGGAEGGAFGGDDGGGDSGGSNGGVLGGGNGGGGGEGGGGGGDGDGGGG